MEEFIEKKKKEYQKMDIGSVLLSIILQSIRIAWHMGAREQIEKQLKK